MEIKLAKDKEANNINLNQIKNKKRRIKTNSNQEILDNKIKINSGNNLLTLNSFNIIINKNNFNFSNSCNNIKKVLCYNDNELNSLDYEKALLNDKRTFMQYYLSLLKIKHLVVFAFYNNKNDYNSQINKINLFFFFLSVHFTVNALFFNDNTMHKIAEDEG